MVALSITLVPCRISRVPVKSALDALCKSQVSVEPNDNHAPSKLPEGVVPDVLVSRASYLSLIHI